MKPITGTRLLFARAFRPILSQSRDASPSPSSPSSESWGNDSSSGLRPPINVINLDTKSSTSNAPEPDFIARAFWAPMLDAIKSRCESKVASCGPLTNKCASASPKRAGLLVHTFIEEFVCLPHLLKKFLRRVIIGIRLLFLKCNQLVEVVKTAKSHTFDFSGQRPIVLPHGTFLLRILVWIKDHLCGTWGSERVQFEEEGIRPTSWRVHINVRFSKSENRR